MSNDVSVETHRGVGRVTLTRPKALHALNAPMCDTILAALERWAADPTVHLVMIDHEEETRGSALAVTFACWPIAARGCERGARFLQCRISDECRAENLSQAGAGDHGWCDHGRRGRPVCAWLSPGCDRAHAVRHAGDRDRPVPGRGGGWFLPRLSGYLGTWLALTGARLKGADVAAARVATHFLPSELVPNLKKQIEGADFSVGAAEMLNEILRGMTHPVPAGSFAAHSDLIDDCFAKDTAEEIVAALDAADNEWASEQAATIRTKSPETVKVALRQVRDGAKLDNFEENMRMEYRIGWRKVQSHDFLEGVRAVIIDKDNAPKWKPATLEEVSDADVARYFEPLGDDELTFGD